MTLNDNSTDIFKSCVPIFSTFKFREIVFPNIKVFNKEY